MEHVIEFLKNSLSSHEKKEIWTFSISNVCLICLHPLLFPCKEGRSMALGSAFKSEQPDFAHCTFLPSNLME